MSSPDITPSRALYEKLLSRITPLREDLELLVGRSVFLWEQGIEAPVVSVKDGTLGLSYTRAIEDSTISVSTDRLVTHPFIQGEVCVTQ